eukprot:TRINITY_DN42209_c0_g1_i1.p1 TRINITY_DN42209_c0_g1~~TRINITY_DN42209_c0_g1_i1.p1  ORF type:complete len:1056 (+),score=192.81 TRINITY_DN42209_c0_g1_i1:151-3318(+)
MVHRRSGASRRSAQKARLKREAQERAVAEEQGDGISAEPAAAVVAGSAAGKVTEEGASASAAVSGRTPVPRGGKPHGLRPESQEVVAAVASLYIDELKPYGRILRKRLTERAAPRGDGGSEPSPEVDVQHLQAVCSSCSQLRVEPEEGGDWSATLVGCPSNFVNVYDPEDIYPASLWQEAKKHFDDACDGDIQLPGGRYSCARELLRLRLPFLRGRSLGQVCHIVQLAISQKKILGYLNGAVVPYAKSQSMMKDRCAVTLQPCASANQDVAELPYASWESARSCLRTMLEEAAAAASSMEGDLSSGRVLGSVPLSNVKRIFRSQFQLELSETVLGHSKLSELMHDARFADICSVLLEGNGYTVVEQPPEDALDDIEGTRCADEAIENEDKDEVDAPLPPSPLQLGFATPLPSPYFTFGAPASTSDASQPTLGRCTESFSFNDSCRVAPGPVVEEDEGTRGGEFCPGEPLFLEDVFDTEATSLAHTPGLFDPTPAHSPCPVFGMLSAPSSLVCTGQWTSLAQMPQLQPTTAGCSGTCDTSLAADTSAASVSLFGLVHNTFIHAAMPPPTPTPGSMRRSRSVPENISSEFWSEEHDTVACVGNGGLVPRSVVNVETNPCCDHLSESTSARSCEGRYPSGHVYSASSTLTGAPSTGQTPVDETATVVDAGVTPCVEEAVVPRMISFVDSAHLETEKDAVLLEQSLPSGYMTPPVRFQTELAHTPPRSPLLLGGRGVLSSLSSGKAFPTPGHNAGNTREGPVDDNADVTSLAVLPSKDDKVASPLSSSLRGRNCPAPLSFEETESPPCEGQTWQQQRCAAPSPPGFLSRGALEGMVQNTFIHAPLPPPTPTVAAAARRAKSLPKDVGRNFASEDVFADEPGPRRRLSKGASIVRLAPSNCGTAFGDVGVDVGASASPNTTADVVTGTQSLPVLWKRLPPSQSLGTFAVDNLARAAPSVSAVAAAPADRRRFRGSNSGSGCGGSSPRSAMASPLHTVTPPSPTLTASPTVADARPPVSCGDSRLLLEGWSLPLAALADEQVDMLPATKPAPRVLRLADHL